MDIIINPFPVKQFVNFTAGSSLSQEEALLLVSRKCVFGDMSLYVYIMKMYKKSEFKKDVL